MRYKSVWRLCRHSGITPCDKGNGHRRARRTESFEELDAGELPVVQQRVVRRVIGSTHLNQQHAQASCGEQTKQTLKPGCACTLAVRFIRNTWTLVRVSNRPVRERNQLMITSNIKEKV